MSDQPNRKGKKEEKRLKEPSPVPDEGGSGERVEEQREEAQAVLIPHVKCLNPKPFFGRACFPEDSSFQSTDEEPIPQQTVQVENGQDDLATVLFVPMVPERIVLPQGAIYV